MNYKQQSLENKLPTCEFTLSDILDDLMALCFKLHDVCHMRFRECVRNKQFSVKGIMPEDLDTHISGTFFWTLEIFGSNGEYMHVIDAKAFKKEDLPHLPYRISKVRIRNDQWYELSNQHLGSSLKPPLYFDLTIDFSTHRVLDLISLPTLSTNNGSRHFVSGINGVDVKGISEEFALFFKKHSNWNFLINAENVYDFLLWIFVLPLMLFYLTNSSEHLPQRILDSRIPIQLIFAIVFFFQALLCFRLTFNIARWFFPAKS